MSFRACGIIVIKDDKTILVETHKGRMSFPKGGLEKGETEFECACRELQEETGLEHTSLDILPNITFDELTNSGKPSVRYYVGYLYKPYDNFKFDAEEINSAKWYTEDELMNLPNLKTQRKEIFKKVLELKN